MNSDELERAIEFLLKNQAAFETRQAAFEANFAASQEAFKESQEAFKEWHAAYRVEQERISREIDALSGRQDRTQQQLDHLSNVVASIAEATRRNSEDIDVLIKLVGGIIERGNGKPES